MALTIADVTGADSVFGNKRVKVKDITFDSAYPTGGESLVPDDVGLTVIDAALPCGPAQVADGTTAVPVKFDGSDNTLKAYHAPADAADAVLDEAANDEDLSGYSVRVVFIGH